ncbi:MAG TPA: ribosome biogenesis GTPase Der [Polyangiaceae bacterium]
MTPIVAVVGRPNVGKSTLFNRLAGKSLAIVDDAPGITRDRHYAPAHLHGRNVTLVDTGGFDPESDDPMQQGIARHVRAALAEADVVVLVLDGSLPPTSADREAVALLRRGTKPVIYAANKVDTAGRLPGANELYELGVPEFVPVSALHGRGTAELAQAVAEQLPEREEEEEEDDRDTPRVALIGRPNAGKSSLFNRLSGSERSLVDARPGTTRDPVDSRITIGGRTFVFVDTAGIRRRARVERGIELVSVLRSIRVLERANVTVLLCDASEGVSEQDARLLGLATERRRAVIVGLNKIDTIPRDERRAALEHARGELAFARWAPILGVSAKTGAGVPELMKAVSAAAEQVRRRITTGELNRFFREVLERHPPPTHRGRAPRVYYMTQAEASPPLFIAWASHADSIKVSYQRFVENQIRKAFDFQAVPVTVHYREREREKKRR